MKTFNEYLLSLNESRVKTVGVMQANDMLSGWLRFYKLLFEIEINIKQNTYYLKIINSENFNIDKFKMIINMSENLGYFPSLLDIDDKNIFEEFKNSNETDFIEFLKKYNIGDFKTIEIKFESWQDKDIEQEDIPDIIYHVCREVNYIKIKKHGLAPKSKSKRSYHPDRIYLIFTLDSAEHLKDILSLETNEEYIILEIMVDDNLRTTLFLKVDANYSNGYYTTTNIHPNYILN